MRGDDQQQDGMFSYISPNKRVPQEHPLRRIRSIVDRVLDQLSPRFRPGKEAKLSYHGHLMTENRSGLVVNTQVTTAYGSAECHAGLLMAEQLPGCGRVTLGADKGYDQREFVEELRCMGVTPHVAQNQGREIKINTRPGQTRESATKRAEPCSIEICQHPASQNSYHVPPPALVRSPHNGGAPEPALL